jgi:hypothetical protein
VTELHQTRLHTPTFAPPPPRPAHAQTSARRRTAHRPARGFGSLPPAPSRLSTQPSPQEQSRRAAALRRRRPCDEAGVSHGMALRTRGTPLPPASRCLTLNDAPAPLSMLNASACFARMRVRSFVSSLTKLTQGGHHVRIRSAYREDAGTATNGSSGHGPSTAPVRVAEARRSVPTPRLRRGLLPRGHHGHRSRGNTFRESDQALARPRKRRLVVHVDSESAEPDRSAHSREA